MNLIVQNHPFLQVNPISLEDFKKYLFKKNKSSPDDVEKIHTLCTQLFNMIKFHVDSNNLSEKEICELPFSHPNHVNIKISTEAIIKVITNVKEHRSLVCAIKEKADSESIFEIMYGLWIAAAKEGFSYRRPDIAKELNMSYNKTYSLLNRNDKQFQGAFDSKFLNAIKKLYEGNIPKNSDENPYLSNFSFSIDPSSFNTKYDAEIIEFKNFKVYSGRGEEKQPTKRMKEIYLFQTRLFNIVKTHIDSEKILLQDEYENSLLNFSHPTHSKKTIAYPILIRLIETVKKFDTLKSTILNYKKNHPKQIMEIMHGLWVAVIRKSVNIDVSIKSKHHAIASELEINYQTASRKDALSNQYENKEFNHEDSQFLSSFDQDLLKKINLLHFSSNLSFIFSTNPSYKENQLNKINHENSNGSSSSSSFSSLPQESLSNNFQSNSQESYFPPGSFSSVEVGNLPGEYDEEIIAFDNNFKLPTSPGQEKEQPEHLKQIYLLQTRLFNIVKKHLASKNALTEEEYKKSPFMFSHPEHSKKIISYQTIIHLIESTKKFEPLKSIILKPKKNLEDHIRNVMHGLWVAAIRNEVKKTNGFKKLSNVISTELDILIKAAYRFNDRSNILKKTFSHEDSEFLGSFNPIFLTSIELLGSQSGKDTRLANNKTTLDETIKPTGFPKFCIQAKLKKMAKNSKNKGTPNTQKVNSEDEQHVEKKQRTIGLFTPPESQYSPNGYEFQFPLLTTQEMDLTNSSSFSFPMLNPASIPFPNFMTPDVGTYSSTYNNSTSNNSIDDDNSIVNNKISTEESIEGFPFL